MPVVASLRCSTAPGRGQVDTASGGSRLTDLCVSLHFAIHTTSVGNPGKDIRPPHAPHTHHSRRRSRRRHRRLGLVGPEHATPSSASSATAVPREALGAIIKEWQKTPDGSGVNFAQSYGASGDQARAVANGLPTDIVQLSTGLDVDYLVEKGLVDKNWDKQSYNGIVTNSLVVFAVRPGNPKKIKTWDDLIKPGVEVITANPFTSGAAKWNILAAYGAQRKLGKTDRQAQAYVQKLFRNVVVQAKSGRDATNAFLSGKGDVLLAYENEALASRKAGQDIQFTIPQADDADRGADRGDQDEPEPRQGEPVHPLHEVGHGRSGSGRSGASGR